MKKLVLTAAVIASFGGEMASARSWDGFWSYVRDGFDNIMTVGDPIPVKYGYASFAAGKVLILNSATWCKAHPYYAAVGVLIGYVAGEAWRGWRHYKAQNPYAPAVSLKECVALREEYLHSEVARNNPGQTSKFSYPYGWGEDLLGDRPETENYSANYLSELKIKWSVLKEQGAEKRKRLCHEYRALHNGKNPPSNWSTVKLENILSVNSKSSMSKPSSTATDDDLRKARERYLKHFEKDALNAVELAMSATDLNMLVTNLPNLDLISPPLLQEPSKIPCSSVAEQEDDTQKRKRLCHEYRALNNGKTPPAGWSTEKLERIIKIKRNSNGAAWKDRLNDDF